MTHPSIRIFDLRSRTARNVAAMVNGRRREMASALHMQIISASRRQTLTSADVDMLEEKVASAEAMFNSSNGDMLSCGATRRISLDNANAAIAQRENMRKARAAKIVGAQRAADMTSITEDFE